MTTLPPELRAEIEQMVDDHLTVDGLVVRSRIAIRAAELAVEHAERRLMQKVDNLRDTILNQRGALAENGMTGEQVNDVLGELDNLFADEFARLNPPTEDERMVGE